MPNEPTPRRDRSRLRFAAWGEAQAEVLRPYRGRFVALAGAEVIAAGDSLAEVFGWLEQHDSNADSVFRVPLNPQTDLGDFSA